ncbi:MAG TPA: NDP-sugar synthase [Candidatus Saccharimonadales bacterium]|jgi:NDP-sugar pyrophosphorylase family protein
MNLQQELDNLAQRTASFHEAPHVSDEQWSEFAANTVVALMAGGESSRYAAVLGGQKVQKNAHVLPNDDTMIEMAIREYRDAGIKKFVALVYHNAHTVEDRLGDGSALGVEIVYSQDPEPSAGKGGAIRNAIENGSIPTDSNLIVVNPDDVILNFPGNYARFIGEAHIEAETRGMLATAVLGLGQHYAATGMMVVDNAVVDTQMYPFIPIPAHVGITVFSAKILPRFSELFSLTEKSDFEQVLFPLLAKEQMLWSAGLKAGKWIAVNDLKSYNELVKQLKSLDTNA